MVHIAIENLLSTCNNRPLYEALWFLAFAKNYRREILEKESITSICNELISRIRDENIDARSFVISTNLLFGTVRLYKTQIDKLYDQTKFALQSCKTTFFQMDWIAEMTQVTSTPIQPVRALKTPKQAPKSTKKKSTNIAAKKSVEVTPILDDVDLIESIYKILDKEIEEVDETLVPGTSRRDVKKNAAHDTGIGIDPTMASDVFAITMKEPSTLMTSGFNSMMMNEDEDDFGTAGNEFENLLKDIADTVLSQGDVIESNLLSTIKSRKRASNLNNSSSIKKRRLTYMNFDDDEKARDANQQVPNIDIYEQMPEHRPVNESSTFNENLNVTEDSSRNLTENQSPTINSTMDLVPMEITNEPIPHTSNNEISQIENDTTMQNVTANNDQTLVENNSLIISANELSAIEPNVPTIEPEMIVQESELILEKIPKKAVKKRFRKIKSLVVDKQKTIPKGNLKKSIDLYKDKMTSDSPFSDFLRRVHYFKSCTDVLFSSGSLRIKNSKLHHLYTRNMKKVPEKLLKKRSNASDVTFNESLEIAEKNSTPKVSKRSAKPPKIVKESPAVEKMEVEPSILPVEESPVSSMPQRYYTRSSKVNKERNVQKQQVPEIDIPSPQMDALSPQVASTSRLNEQENQELEVSTSRKVEGSLAEENMEVDLDIIPPILPIEESPVSSMPQRYYTRSIMVLKERNVQKQQVINNPSPQMDIFLSPQIPSAFCLYEQENQQVVQEFEMPPALDKENNSNIMNMNEGNENSDINRVSHKKVVLTKLKELWKQKDRSVTMNKLCSGMQRAEAAGAFFEILLLAKYRSIELVQETGSLEISNILCKISSKQLSK